VIVRSMYPVVCSERLKESRDFYAERFGMQVTFDSDWYVGLRSPDERTFELGFVGRQDESVPASFRVAAQGVVVTIEVDDVDAVLTVARAGGWEIVQELRHEAWGQRHFMTIDPNGLLVDVVQPVEPSGEFAERYP